MPWRQRIRAVPDFPKPGIMFRDITPVLEDPVAFAAAVAEMASRVATLQWDRVAALEARGFLFGAPLALHFDRGLVLCRKPGKLPREVASVDYALEYGTAGLEIHTDALASGQKVLVVDDLLATGGTAAAAGELIRSLGAEVAAYLFLVELEGLGGREKLTDAPVISLVNLPG